MVDDAAKLMQRAFNAASELDRYPLTAERVVQMLRDVEETLDKTALLKGRTPVGDVSQVYPIGPRMVREFAMAWLVVHGGKNAQ
jgi:hypothetical protein